MIGFAGQKQAGKDTACNFILAIKLAELGLCKASRISKSGSIEVTDIFNENMSGKEWFPFAPPHVDVDSLFEDHLGGFVRSYAFADTLKEFAIGVFGLDRDLVYGSNADKDKATYLKWEDVPTATPTDKQGSMTVREVLQYVGTDLFRKMHENVWVDTCLRRINQDSAELALVSDVRFENEIRAIQKAGGIVIGLTRTVSKNDSHRSETEINSSLSLCDKIIDNKKLSIAQQNQEIYSCLKKLKCIPEII
jgi:hypothetical protein